MYLAPLNYDRFFKKVFSDIEIAKMFLEDFLEEEIEDIEVLGSKHKITDDARIVEFDYRCKIKGNYIIIDMQQWFKPDISQRFYIYHSLNSALQLEKLGTKVLRIEQDLDNRNKKIKEIKDYRLIEPVLTLIWMVDDNLGYNENYISFSLIPHHVEKFIKDVKLWKKENMKKLMLERDKIIEMLKNNKREVDFLGKNKLIFMLQKNIVKSEKLKKYVDWFDFAEKTKNKNNTEEDFKEYKKDKRFKEAIRRLDRSNLTSDDIKYINTEDELWYKIKKYETDIAEVYKKEGHEEGIKEGIKEGEKKRSIEVGKNLLNNGVNIQIISQATGLSIEEIEKLKE
ncbi:MAG: hypothetical protein B6I28_02025 [Fusobacteriia bacterium 4572_132]|nr:MAG: hypothetical protein B6I28_02025 [Fusobacteriia bacterium 4572_132]